MQPKTKEWIFNYLSENYTVKKHKNQQFTELYNKSGKKEFDTDIAMKLKENMGFTINELYDVIIAYKVKTYYNRDIIK